MDPLLSCIWFYIDYTNSDTFFFFFYLIHDSPIFVPLRPSSPLDTPFRPTVVESLVAVISKPELRDAQHTASLHTVLHHERCLLDMWTRILRENTDGQAGLLMIPDE